MTPLQNGTRWRVVSSAADLPDSPGCYAVYRDGGLVYIGSTTSLRKRVSQYFRREPRLCRRGKRAWTIFGSRSTKSPARDAFVIKVAESSKRGDWLRREYRLITRLVPCENRRIWRGPMRRPVQLFQASRRRSRAGASKDYFGAAWAARKASGLTQKALAKKAAVRLLGITNMERYGWVPPDKVRQRLSEALGVPVATLFPDLPPIEAPESQDSVAGRL